MEHKMQALINAVRENVCAEAHDMRRQNAVLPVSGLRMELPLPGRTLDAVFYRTGSDHAPLIVGFHGGGFLFGGCAMDDGMWAAVRDTLQVNVISVGYRKTPEYTFPAPVEDAYDALSFLTAQSEELGFDPAHISVMGASAGANLAAAVCLMLAERGGAVPERQILIYPYLDLVTDPIEKGFSIQDAAMYCVFNELYVRPEQAGQACCSPLFAPDALLRSLPPAVICTAEADLLCGEGLAYAARLRTQGVRVDEDAPAAGMPHGYFEFAFADANPERIGFMPESERVLQQNGSMRRAAESTLAYLRDTCR